ncbi:unnamed protein product [Lactuca saligna]|uniref:Uncharacterized protein n=1 Tax=Lactuca saligna TaxID=75948 RepID=A0AA35ZNH7_LACSI|nr:unnamed protein product [Lactuca saligna]
MLHQMNKKLNSRTSGSIEGIMETCISGAVGSLCIWFLVELISDEFDDLDKEFDLPYRVPEDNGILSDSHSLITPLFMNQAKWIHPVPFSDTASSIYLRPTLMDSTQYHLTILNAIPFNYNKKIDIEGFQPSQSGGHFSSFLYEFNFTAKHSPNFIFYAIKLIYMRHPNIL